MRKAAKNLGLLDQEGDSLDGDVMNDVLQKAMLERARAQFRRKRLNAGPPPEELQPEPPPAPVFRTASSAVVCDDVLPPFNRILID